ncbi:hypothetical protein [Curtobacterium sp. MCSS17_007]|nr:hypothetical protein [Curtobacterium sp. MCSS17_007]WIE76724.1 hypothetical protein DEJ22_005550 [Curtobacterium sp. MCSS17_007]
MIALATVGGPAVGAIVMLLRRRRDRSVTLVGPIACIVIAVV